MTLNYQTATNPAVKHTAIIDVGSNSFRLIVIEFIPERWFHLVDEIRESVRLAEHMSLDGNLQPAAMTRAIDTLNLYVAFCKTAGINDVRACATAAVRIAKNQEEFLARVRQETGLEVEVLSDEQEAYFGYLSAVNSTLLENGFIADLGGASVEVTRVENRQMRESISLKMGAVSATENYLSEPPVSAAKANNLYQAIFGMLQQLDWFRAKPNLTFLGQGGTIRNMARMSQKTQNYTLGELHNYFLERDTVNTLCDKLVGLELSKIKRIPGMKEDRADIMLGGATVVKALMDVSGFDRMEICSQGLREGVFYDRYLYHKTFRRFDDVRRSTIINLSNLYPYQQTHAEHVAYLALRMFDQAPPDTMKCAIEDRGLLWAASILHDIGASIDYNDHHKHSFYLILNAGLPGFNHRELLMIALLARYHRKGDPSVLGYTRILNSDDRKKLIQMTACLRLAEQLDRSRDGVVRNLNLKTEGKTAYLELDVNGDGVIALWSVVRHTDIFEKAFNKKLDIQIRTTFPAG